VAKPHQTDTISPLFARMYFLKISILGFKSSRFEIPFKKITILEAESEVKIQYVCNIFQNLFPGGLII